MDYKNNSSLEYAIKKINSWYRRNIKFLTIITTPFNTSCIFAEIIDEFIKNNGKVLYVWGKTRQNRELIGKIREKNSKTTYSYIQNSKKSDQLIFANFYDLYDVRSNYDLIIFDDISCFSNLTLSNVRNHLEICNSIGKRVILYSTEKSSIIGEKIDIASYDYKKPFVEPRILMTRVNLNLDIPYSLYDYLEWFSKSNKKVAIYLPDLKKIDFFYDYFKYKLKIDNLKVLKAVTTKEIEKNSNVLNYDNKSIFIITNRYKELLDYCYVDDVVVLFSDNKRFGYKDLIYICGQVRKASNDFPEVLLVANSLSEDMERAKDMARKFNEKVWEKSLREL